MSLKWRREANSKENAKSIQNRGAEGEGGRKGKGGGERQTVKKTQNQYRIRARSIGPTETFLTNELGP